MLGYGEMVETIDERGRCAAGRYLEGVAQMANKGKIGGGSLEVWTSLRVDKVVFEKGVGGTPRAVGVATSHGVIRAKREVVCWFYLAELDDLLGLLII